MVLGVEPGSVIGVSPIDNASLSAGIGRFLRNSVGWSPQYAPYEDKQILVITVEPPEFGDPIVAMLREFQTNEPRSREFNKGDVFIRRHGRNDRAEQEDFDMLVRRFASGPLSASGIGLQLLRRFGSDRETPVKVWTRFHHVSGVRTMGEHPGELFPYQFWFKWKVHTDEMKEAIDSYVSSLAMRRAGILRDSVAKSCGPAGDHRQFNPWEMASLEAVPAVEI